MIHRLDLPAETRRHLPVEKLHGAVAFAALVQGGIAGIAQTRAGAFAVLQGEFVLAAEKRFLHMLRGDRPTAVGVTPSGFFDVAQAKLQLTAGVGLEACHVEVVTGGVFLLVEVVLARQRVAVFEVADFDVLDTAARGALVPVVEVRDMDVVTLVVTAPRPHRAAIEAGQVGPLRVHLRHARRAVVLTLELQGSVVFVVQRCHGIDAQHRAVVEGQQVLAQLEFGVLLAFVAQAVFGLRPRQLETLLLATAC